jgi:hypothetical protein
MGQQPNLSRWARKAVVLAVGGLLAASCGGDGDGGTGGAGEAASATTVASPDEVIQVVEQGFGVRRIAEGPGYQVDALDHGFVIQNVSDQVAIDVRLEVTALDPAGNPIEGLSMEGTTAFGVVLPGQRLGAGGSTRLDDGEVIGGIDIRVTMIVALDTPDGRDHRRPPGPYVELAMTDPVPDPARADGADTWFTTSVTNTYDIDVRPTVRSVLRGADGSIIGGGDSGDATGLAAPGASAAVEFRQSSGSPELDAATAEYYAVPQVDMPLTPDVVWIDP